MKTTHKWARTLISTCVAFALAVTGVISAATPAGAATAQPIAEWTFAEPPAITGSSAAANVIPASGGSDSTATLRPVTTDPVIGYTYEAGEKSIRYQGWDNPSGTKSWVVELSTRGYVDVTVSSQQQSSGSGPRDFALQVSLDGQQTWQNVTGGTLTVSTGFAAAGSLDKLPLPADIDDKDAVALRWLVTSNTSAGGGQIGDKGSSRIRGIAISGTPTGPSVDVPTTVASLAPASNAKSVSADARVAATFNKAVSVTAGAEASIVDDEGTPVTGVSLTAAAKTVTVAHAPLELGRRYTVTIPKQAVAGTDDEVSPQDDVVWSFTTADPAQESVAEWVFRDTGDKGVFWATGGAYQGHSALTSVGTNTDYMLSTSDGIWIQGWDGGKGAKYWLAALPTAGFEDITVSSEHKSSGSGPRDFALELSTDRATWTPVAGGTIRALNGTFACDDDSCRLRDLPLPAVADNASVLYLRWIMTSNEPTNPTNPTVGAYGDNFLRNVIIKGDRVDDSPLTVPTFPILTEPRNGATSVAVDAAISLRFNKPVNLSDGATATIVDGHGTSLTGVSLTADGTIVTVAHPRLAPSQNYTITLEKGAVAGAEDAVTPTQDVAWSFRTAEPSRDSVVEWAFNSTGDDGVFWATGGAYRDRSAITSVGTKAEYRYASSDGISTYGWGGGKGNKYWLASLSTAGFENITISSEHKSSGSGPRDFALELSTDRTNWSKVDGSTIRTVTHSWTCPGDSCRLKDLPLAGADNQPVLYLRWIMTSNEPSNTDENTTVGGYGDNYLRNVQVKGDRLEGVPLTVPTFDVLTRPLDGTSEVDFDAEVSVRFNKPVLLTEAGAITITDAAGQPVAGVTASANGSRITLAHPLFELGGRYTVSVPRTAITGNDGVAPLDDLSWSFSAPVKTPTAFTMNFNGDPRTAMAFAWYTSPAVSGTVVEVAPGTSTGGTFPTTGVLRFDGTSGLIDTFVTASDRSARRTVQYASHKVQATNLTPGTSYVYRAGDGTPNGWGPTGSFTTDTADPQPFRFIFGSDSQASDLGSFLEWQDTFAKAVRKVADPRFLLVTGDLVDNGDLEEQWQWMLNSAAEQFATVPYVPILGGHEVEDSGTTMNNNFYNHFNLPRDVGTGAHEGSVYSFEYGDALFLQFNSQYAGGLDKNGEVAWVDSQFTKQLDWLRRTVAASDRHWKFVSLHKGPYSAGENACIWEGDRIEFYEKYLVPIFQETGVDVVFEAHDHMYMRSHQMLDGKPVDVVSDEQGNPIVQFDATDPQGVLYLMPNALGNKFYKTPDGCNTSFAAINDQPEKKMFVEVSVSRGELSLEAYTAAVADQGDGDDGLKRYDHYRITRTDAAPNPVQQASATLSGGLATITWSAPATSTEPVRGYRIYEKNDRVGTNWSVYVAAQPGVTQYTHAQPVSDDPTIRYDFVIKAVGRKDNSTPVTASAEIASTDGVAPSVPQGLTAEAVSQYQVKLSWLPSTDNVGVAGYKVFRDGELLGRTTAPAFSDTGRDPGATYGYWVSAYDAAGNESALSTASQITMPKTPTSSTPHRPFGQHTRYAPGTIKPSVPQAAMDAKVAELYDAWKDEYLTQNPYQPDQYYVYYNGDGYAEPEDAVTTSESNGYGMLTTAIMAGHDPEAKTLFDGLLRFAKAHPSSVNPDLMAWQQRDNGTAIVNTTIVEEDWEGGDDAATDGDLDMAYALLLADQQWGSGGEFNYLAEARRVMNAILASEVNATHNTLQLGDWTFNEVKYAGATRPSDFMTQHLKDFANASGQSRWIDVVDKTYSIEEILFRDYSPQTGLLPDFVERIGSSYRPAPPDFLEGEHDGDYNWNSARTPWRIGTDYLMTGDQRPKAQLAAMNAWIKSATGGDPEKVAQGYTLAGEPLDPDPDITFSAPFAVSAMLDASNQEWLDALWTTATQEPVTSYFGDSVRLLSLIVVSGNWWSPTGVGIEEVDQPLAAPTGLIASATGPTTVQLTWDGSTSAKLAGYRVYRDGKPIATVDPGTGTVTFGDTGLAAATRYQYHVTAVDDLGNESEASATVSVTTPAGVRTPTTTVLQATASAAYGTPVTLTATVSGKATGTVRFLSGAEALGEAALANGKATLVVHTLPAGSHSLTASYGGDSTYAPSTSKAVKLTIAKAKVTLSKPTLSRTKIAWGSTTAVLSVKVTGLAVGKKVTFVSGKRTIGVGQVTRTTDGTVVKAPISTSVPIGKYAGIKAVWSGDANHGAATSAAGGKTLTVVKAKPASIKVKGAKFRKNTRPTVTVTVGRLDNGQWPAGKVKLTISGQKSITVKLTTHKAGVLTVKLGKSTKNVAVQAEFRPADTKHVSGLKSQKVTIRKR